MFEKIVQFCYDCKEVFYVFIVTIVGLALIFFITSVHWLGASLFVLLILALLVGALLAFLRSVKVI